MKLYYFLTPNARKACAVARHLGLKPEYRFVDLGKGEQRAPEFLAINPNGRVPALEDDGRIVWESNAIMYYLARKAGSELWPRDDRELDVIRWLSWDLAHFTRHTGTLFYEGVVKPQIGLGEPTQDILKDALDMFRRNAPVLDAHLAGRSWVVGNALTVADFALASYLPEAPQSGVPLAEFPNINRWHRALSELPAWAEPFPAQH
jgi:glutathione S-transferase